MPWPDDDTLGAFGSGATVPTGDWFPVNTQTGTWGSPTPTLASAAGLPDVGPAPLGLPDQAPLAIGQVAGGVAPQMTTPRSMQRVQRLDAMGGLTPQPGLWESIARGVAMASPMGRATLQYGDSQAQQALQNRLVARRQMLQEDQEARAATQEGYRTLVAISQIKNKALRNMQFDRFAAQAAEAGQPLPADFIETYKKSTLAEGEGIAQAYGPLLEKAGFNKEQTARILESGDLDTIKGLLEGGLKVRKQAMEEEEQTRFGQIMGGGTGTVGAAGGQAAPAAPGALGAPATTAPLANVGMRETPGGREPLPIRMNNPLNIKQGPATQKWIDQGAGVPGDPATDGGRFIKFQTPQQGVEAAQDLLTGKAYSGLSVDAALKKWSNNGYGGEIVTGVDPTKKIADLTPGELTRTMGAMMQREGGGTGGGSAQRPDTRMLVAGPGAPAPVRGTAQDNTALVSLDQEIAANEQKLTQLSALTSERANRASDNLSKRQDVLIKRRDQLTEPSRAGVRTRVEAEVKADVEERVKGRQTAAEVLGERVTTFFDKDTGEQESPGQSMNEMRQRLGDKKVAVLSTDQAKQLSVLKQLEPVLDGYQRLVTYAYGPKGPLKDFSRQPLETVTAMWDQAGQKDPQLQAMRRSLEGQLQSVVRGLGARGDLNAQELEAAKQMLANFDASLGLGFSAGAGIGRGGVGPMVGIRPTISVPDTPQTGMRVANELFGLVNQRIGSLLGNPGYAKTKLLEIPEAPPVNPDDPRYQFGFVPPEVMEARQQRARQAPQATPPPPAAAAPSPPAQAVAPPSSGQQALRAMSAAQLRQAPDRLVQAIIANPGMAAGLSPEQNGALMERLNQFEQQGARRGR